jgi:tripartite ATP-independent transporter DctM subunit
VLGSLAGSGTLGILIPPSIIMIVYGVAADVPITHLFIAGVLPGIMLMALFSGYIAIHALLNPGQYPTQEPGASFMQNIVASRRLVPVVGLILAVIGSIYFGIATATEAAAVGVVGALVIAALSGTLSWESFQLSVRTATRTNCMIFFILAGSAFLSGAMGFTGIPRLLAAYAGESQLSAANLIIVLTLLMIILGCFIDGISLVVLTTSVLMPMVIATKIDPLWFGIYLVLVVEMGLVTPPVGFNLFVIQALTNRNLFYIGKVALPFFLLMVVAVWILWWFPEIATWLPARITARS